MSPKSISALLDASGVFDSAFQMLPKPHVDFDTTDVKKSDTQIHFLLTELTMLFPSRNDPVLLTLSKISLQSIDMNQFLIDLHFLELKKQDSPHQILASGTKKLLDLKLDVSDRSCPTLTASFDSLHCFYTPQEFHDFNQCVQLCLSSFSSRKSDLNQSEKAPCVMFTVDIAFENVQIGLIDGFDEPLSLQGKSIHFVLRMNQGLEVEANLPSCVLFGFRRQISNIFSFSSELVLDTTKQSIRSRFSEIHVYMTKDHMRKIMSSTLLLLSRPVESLHALEKKSDGELILSSKSPAWFSLNFQVSRVSILLYSNPANLDDRGDVSIAAVVSGMKLRGSTQSDDSLRLDLEVPYILLLDLSKWKRTPHKYFAISNYSLLSLGLNNLALAVTGDSKSLDSLCGMEPFISLTCVISSKKTDIDMTFNDLVCLLDPSFISEVGDLTPTLEDSKDSRSNKMNSDEFVLNFCVHQRRSRVSLCSDV
jgi:hypothetical protein